MSSKSRFRSLNFVRSCSSWTLPLPCFSAYFHRNTAIILVSSLIFSPFVWYNKHKTWRRVLGDQAFRWATGLKIPQLQSLLGTTLTTYRSTVAKLNIPAVEEDIGSNARLLWLGSKQSDHVLLYLHGKKCFWKSLTCYTAYLYVPAGGAFLGPATDASFYFWRHVQEQLKARFNIDLGVVILTYSKRSVNIRTYTWLTH